MDHPQRPLFALGLRIASAGCFATMFFLIKVVGESGVALPEIMFWRQFVSVPLILGYLALRGQLVRLRTAKLGAHALRAGVGMTGMVCSFSATLLLPLAESTVLGFTAPLFAVLITALVMREHVGPWRLLAVVLGFVGVVVIAQPGNAPISTLGAVLALLSGLVTATISFLIRSLGRSEESISVVFYFAAFGAAAMLFLLPFYVTAHDGQQWLLLMAVGLTGMFGQFLMTSSLRHGAISSVVVMDYTALIWATLYGWLAWDHLPGASTWLGAPLIIAAGATIAWREHRLGRQPSPVSAIETD